MADSEEVFKTPLIKREQLLDSQHMAGFLEEMLKVRQNWYLAGAEIEGESFRLIYKPSPTP